MLLYPDKPSCQGVENVLRRADRLAQLRYTPIRPLPISVAVRHPDKSASYIEALCSAYMPVKGVLYSSVRRLETYVGFNVTPETFLSALSNPDSVAYNDTITGTGQNVHNHYGIVCSCFVSYAVDLPYRTKCSRWPSIPGIHEVDSTRLENLQLADIVLNVKTHIALITGIERDVEGKVHYITVSESTMPYVRVTRFSAEEFRGYWLNNGYVIYRYDGVRDATYTPDPFAPAKGDPELPAPFINPSLMPNFGNKANYRLGLDPVKLSVFEEGCESVEITAPDGGKIRIPVTDGKAVFEPEAIGFYSACCVRADGNSEPVFWCVTDLRIAPEKESYTQGEAVTMQVFNPAGDPLAAWQFNRRDTDRGNGDGWLNHETAGPITVPGPLAAADVELYLIAKNAYGFYASRRVPLKILPAEE
ncbi:MAG: hypothetical protein J5496_04305 [Lachnospiraceae bacterium]|nr:hypothetical protein [Lachnospiraceae bacterium]